MSTFYRGRVQDSVIVLDGDVKLPEGSIVVVTVAEPAEQPPAGEGVYALAELAVPTGIPDLALNIDHYLYGHPRR